MYDDAGLRCPGVGECGESTAEYRLVVAGQVMPVRRRRAADPGLL
jgi:hypothetical protein